MILDRYMRENAVADSDLARLIKVTQPYIGRLRRGERRPSPEVAKRLEAHTGIPAAHLIFGEP